MQSQLKILFIDDHVGLRDSLSISLQKMNPLFKFYLAADMEKAMVSLKSNKDIEIAIVDLNLNGQDGLALVDQLRQVNPQIKIIIYTMYNDPMHIQKSLEKNIQGFITKELDLEEIEKALLVVKDGNFFYCKDAQKIMTQIICKNNSTSAGGFNESVFKNYQTLTTKEQEVFELLAQKLDDQEIAAKLNKSLKTIQNKKSLIYSKMKLKDRLELVEAAKFLGVIV
ncbi:MAG: response regulator transcription factor [Treponema sp.]|nr:response regulator transcription factor [Treponema sp.]